MSSQINNKKLIKTSLTLFVLEKIFFVSTENVHYLQFIFDTKNAIRQWKIALATRRDYLSDPGHPIYRGHV